MKLYEVINSTYKYKMNHNIQIQNESQHTNTK